MNSKIPIHGDIDGNRSRRKCDGIGESHESEVSSQLASEFEDLRVDKVHHSWMKGQEEDMEIGQEDLVKKPWGIEEKTPP